MHLVISSPRNCFGASIESNCKCSKSKRKQQHKLTAEYSQIRCKIFCSLWISMLLQFICLCWIILDEYIYLRNYLELYDNSVYKNQSYLIFINFQLSKEFYIWGNHFRYKFQHFLIEIQHILQVYRICIIISMLLIFPLSFLILVTLFSYELCLCIKCVTFKCISYSIHNVCFFGNLFLIF